MKTIEEFEGQPLSIDQMRSTDGGGWPLAVGIVVGAILLVQMVDAALEVKTGEYKCDCTCG